jgi:flagellar motor switch protein FliG
VLTYLETQKASAVLALFPTDTQTEIAHRIAVMEPTHPEMVRALAAVLQNRFELLAEDDTLETFGGVTPLVGIMNFTDRETERLILTGIEFRNPDLAEEIRNLLFVFEDIVQLEDRAAQLVLRQVETGELALALKGAPEDVRDKVMSNMSERAAENLADEIDLLGSVRLAQIQEARKAIVRQIRLLDEAGEIVIQRGNVEESVS